MKSKSARLLFSCTLALVSLATSPGSARAAIVADYQLQNVLTSSVPPAGPLTLLGGNFITATVAINMQSQMQIVLNSPVNSTGPQGVAVNTASFLTATTYSVVLLAAFDFSGVTGSPVAEKLIDFKNRSSDNGVYVNTTTGLISFLGPTPLQIGGTPAVSGTYTQIVLTRDSSGVTTLYQNGTQAFQFTDTNNDAVLGDAAMGTGAFLTVFSDDTVSATDEGLAGNLARVRIYNTALSATEVAALTPLASIPEPSTWALLAVGCGALVVVVRQRRAARVS